MSRRPNLLILGVTKAGTTSLFDYLVQHPEICGSSLKETEYFSRLVYPGASLEPIDDYLRYFRHCGGERYVMEASANYWYGGPRLRAALESELAGPRYLITLRDPVTRFWSDFTYMKSKVLLPPAMTVDEFLDRCEEMRAAERDFTEAGRHYRTLSTGMYREHLFEWLDAAGDRLRLVFFENLRADPTGVVSGILEWLGVDAAPAVGFDYRPRNPTVSHRSGMLQRAAHRAGRRVDAVLRRYPRVKGALVATYNRVNAGPVRADDLPPGTQQRLADLYRAENEKLAAELRSRGYRDLPGWLAAR